MHTSRIKKKITKIHRDVCVCSVFTLTNKSPIIIQFKVLWHMSKAMWMHDECVSLCHACIFYKFIDGKWVRDKMKFDLSNWIVTRQFTVLFYWNSSCNLCHQLRTKCVDVEMPWLISLLFIEIPLLFPPIIITFSLFLRNHIRIIWNHRSIDLHSVTHYIGLVRGRKRKVWETEVLVVCRQSQFSLSVVWNPCVIIRLGFQFGCPTYVHKRKGSETKRTQKVLKSIKSWLK